MIQAAASSRSRISKPPPAQMPPPAVNATSSSACRDASILPQQDPNIRAATTALIFPHSHELFYQSPPRRSESGSRRSRTAKRTTPSASSSRSKRVPTDHEVSQTLRNDGFQERARAVSANRSGQDQSREGSARSRSSIAPSSYRERVDRSTGSRASDKAEDAGEWGQRKPFPPRVNFAIEVPPVSRWSATTASSIDTEDGEATPRASGESQTPRKSKFIEGSMNVRSLATSSAWRHDKHTSASDGDGKDVGPVTPGRRKGDKNKPLPAIPSPKTIKKTGLFRFGSHNKEPPQEADKDANGEEPTSRRKGLRGSKSIFNFKLFNSSKVDISAKPHVDPSTPRAKAPKITKRKQPASEQDKTVDLLNERKRKAEEAYAEQFGNRKSPKTHATDTANRTPLQPSVASVTNAPTPVTAIRRKPVKDQRGPVLSRKQPVANLKTSVSSRSLRSASAASLRKRPSRKDLESENAELRAMLVKERERNQTIAVNGDPLKDYGAHSKTGNTGPAMAGLENIPPVPRLPGKGALDVLEGRLLRSHGKVSELGGMDVWGRERSLEMGEKEPWEWPDDVF